MSKFTFIVPDESHAELTLAWRRKPAIARQMFTTVDHNIEEQRTWLRNAVNRTDYRHWLICAGGRPIGLCNMQKIDWQTLTTSNGYYIGEDDALPLAGLVLPYLFNHVFFELDFSLVWADVISDNNIMRLNRILGYEEEPLTQPFERQDGTVALLRLKLSRERWLKNTRFHRYRADFPWPTGKQMAL